MRRYMLICLGIFATTGLLSGCSGNDAEPVLTPSGPTASAEDHRTPRSDALTAQETALINQGNSEPIPAAKPDL